MGRVGVSIARRRPGSPLSPAVVVVLLSTAFAARPATAQILFDWPVRSMAVPEALLTGAPALLWNPAGASPAMAGRRQVWVAHVDGPEASGIQGLVGAAAFDLPVVGRVGATYQHLGVPDIPRTTDSPEPEPGSLTVTEDLAVLSLAQSLTSHAGLGTSIRLMRGTVGSDRRNRVSVDFGAQTRWGGSLAPAAGAVLRSIGTRSELLLGLDGRIPLPWQRLGLRGGYGLQAPLSRFVASHELALRGTWDRRFVFGVGALSHAEDAWTALLELRVDIDRYSLGVVREGLPNGFGATHYFQITIDLDKPEPS